MKLFFLIIQLLACQDISTSPFKTVLDSINGKLIIISSDSKKIQETKEILQDCNLKIETIINENCTDYEEDIQKALIKLRKALIEYYFKFNLYPLYLDELVPRFISCIPEINIHGEKSKRIKYVSNLSYDKNYNSAIDETTEYIYFSNPRSKYWGLLILNRREDEYKKNDK
jgi:hypothetical protein